MDTSETYAAQLAGMQPKPNQSLPPVQFQLGEAMIAQKKLAKTGKDVKQLQEIVTELQIYVQKHHVKINKDLVEMKQLQMTVETLQTQLEIRFDMTQTQQMDRIKLMIEDLVTRQELDKRLLDKLHKREFEKQFERLENSYQALEAKVVNSIPAMSHELKLGLEKKAGVKDLEQVREEKASLVLVEALVKRLNKLEETVTKGVAAGVQHVGAYDKGHKFGNRASPNKVTDGELSELIEEEDDEDQSEVATTTFHAGKTVKSENVNAAVSATAAAEMTEKIEKLQANFTKQLEAMQLVMNQQVDTRLKSMTEAFDDEQKENKANTELEMAALKSDIQALQASVKKGASLNRGDMSPSASPRRQESSMSVLGQNNNNQALNLVNQLGAQVRRIEDQLQNFDKKFTESEKNKLKQNSVDVYAFSKHVESEINKFEQHQSEHFKRVVQTENSTKALHQEISGMSQDFKNKVSKIGKDVVKLSNLKEEVKIRIDQFSQVLSELHNGFLRNNIVQDQSLNGMKELLRGEMKDLKAANQTFEFELSRIQTLFRQLQNELIQTMEEKKAQNSSILQTVTEAAGVTGKDTKTVGKQRSQSVSQQPSILSLLPQIKMATVESVTKLTHRQLRVADIFKSGRPLNENPSGLFSPINQRNPSSTHDNRRLNLDNSMLSLGTRNGIGSNEGIASHKLFLTNIQQKDSRANSRQNVDSTIDLKPTISQTEVKQRKVFGAQDYLERQERMKDPTNNTSMTKSHNQGTAVDEDFAEFHVKLGSQLGSVSKLF